MQRYENKIKNNRTFVVISARGDIRKSHKKVYSLVF